MKTILRLEELIHYSKDGDVLFKQGLTNNLIHISGDLFITNVLFAGEVIPTSYFLGLDNRTVISEDDLLAGAIATEPIGNGYLRKPFLSVGEVVIGETQQGWPLAQTPIITYNASGGSWGPVNNVFMTNTSGDTGYLISSVRLSNPVTLQSGEKITLRTSVAFRDCT